MERTLQKRLSVGSGSWVVVDVYGDPDVPGLVVVPGVMSDADGWRHVVRATDAWPSVSVVNRRGRLPSGPLTDTYSIQDELEDLEVVLGAIPEPRTLFGWSYGALITLLSGNARPTRHIIAYEPVVPPFGSHALADLEAAAEAADWDRSVEIVNRQISELSAERVEALRADQHTWTTLRRLSQPLHAELRALSEASVGDTLARHAEHVDLIVGECNRGAAPYGTTFDDVRDLVPHGVVHQLANQGHMAHVQAPAELGRMLNSLSTASTPFSSTRP